MTYSGRNFFVLRKRSHLPCKIALAKSCAVFRKMVFTYAANVVLGAEYTQYLQKHTPSFHFCSCVCICIQSSPIVEVNGGGDFGFVLRLYK